jgi:hypothetical protein
MTQTLTAPEVVEQKSTGHRFFVEPASDESELDVWGIPVPVEFKTIDVAVVTEPTREAIATLVADCEWLLGYKGSRLLPTEL